MIPLTRLAQETIAQALAPGDWALDGTVGNGWDTLFLARQVGAAGRVWGCDVQQRALERTRQRLSDAGMDRVVLVRACHSGLTNWLPDEARGRLRAIMFNLGYLPGDGDGVPTVPPHITRPETTLAALQGGLEVLAPGGCLTVLCYRGHAGGAEEAARVAAWANGLGRDVGTVGCLEGAGKSAEGPVLWTARKKPA